MAASVNSRSQTKVKKEKKNKKTRLCNKKDDANFSKTKTLKNAILKIS